MNRIIATFLVYFLFQTITIAQNVVIEGVIKDSEQKEVLPYVNIFLKNIYLGTVSNQKGQFKIIIPEDKRGSTGNIVVNN
jgi:hypothetical protein